MEDKEPIKVVSEDNLKQFSERLFKYIDDNFVRIYGKSYSLRKKVGGLSDTILGEKDNS